MVEVKKSIFDNIVLDTYKNALPFINPDIKAYIHVGNETIPIDFIFYYEIKSDYNKSLADEIFIEFLLKTSDYLDKLVPNINDLKISIVYKINRDDIDNTILYTKTYNFLLTHIDKTLKESHRHLLDAESIDATSVMYLRGQLVEPILYKLKSLLTSGIYRNTKVKDVIYGVMYNALTSLNIPYKHNMVPPDNDRVYDHIIIKSKTKVVKLPHYLQVGDYGVYNGGIGTYIQQEDNLSYTLYNYPLYDYSKFNVGKRDRLLIYNPVKTSYGINDISHAYVTNDTCASTKFRDYKLISTDVTILDKRDRKFIESFDTLYNVDPYVAFDYKSITVGSDGITFDTNNLVKLYKSSANKSQVSNYLYTNMDDNLYKFKSYLVYNETILAKIVIPNTEATIFKPGMPVKYFYLKDDIVIGLDGVLQSIHVIFNRLRKSNAVVLYVALEKGE